MYGIVNKAIEGLVKENFGEGKWLEIKALSGVDVEIFLSNEPYPDETTFKLAIAASDVLSMPLESVLVAFGEYWILKTGQENYGSLMKAGGHNLKEFLMNLPNFHSRVMLIYPELTPPEFKISDIEEHALHVHYFSQRSGLDYFMLGLLQGLAKMFSVKCQIQFKAQKRNGDHHDIFHVSW